MTWAVIVIAIVLACLIYGPALPNGDKTGMWRFLRHLGFRRELKMLWPEGHDRVLTAERGAYRPPLVAVYYWMNYPIWERPYRTQDTPGEYSFRYAVIAIALAVISIILTMAAMMC